MRMKTSGLLSNGWVALTHIATTPGMVTKVNPCNTPWLIPSRVPSVSPKVPLLGETEPDLDLLACRLKKASSGCAEVTLLLLLLRTLDFQLNQIFKILEKF